MNKERIWTLLSRKLAGEASEAEMLELNDLISADSNLHLSLEAINEYWEMPLEKDSEFLEATYHLHLGRMKQMGHDLHAVSDEEHPAFTDFSTPAPVNRMKRMLAFAIGFIAISAIGLLLYKSGNAKTVAAIPAPAIQSQVSTKSGSRSKVQLPDGSSVWLNCNSQLVYDNQNFGKNIREVTLTGEAYFDVVKNPEKPFVIHTTRMDIKVLGTAFNVKSYPDEKSTETSLVRGSIEVTLKDRQEKIMLKPNEKLVVGDEEYITHAKTTTNAVKATPAIAFSLGHLSRLPLDSSIVETAWVDNRLVFNNESFSEIALKMERWYGVNISFADQKMLNIHFTGSFEKETIAQALTAIKLSTPTAFNYTINNNIIKITK